MDAVTLQNVKFGLAVLGTLLIPLVAWVGSIAYKTGGAKTTLNGHTKQLDKLDNECAACRKGVSARIGGVSERIGAVHEGVIRLETQMEMLLKLNGAKRRK